MFIFCWIVCRSFYAFKRILLRKPFTWESGAAGLRLICFHKYPFKKTIHLELWSCRGQTCPFPYNSFGSLRLLGSDPSVSSRILSEKRIGAQLCTPICRVMFQKRSQVNSRLFVSWYLVACRDPIVLKGLKSEAGRTLVFYELFPVSIQGPTRNAGTNRRSQVNLSFCFSCSPLAYKDPPAVQGPTDEARWTLVFF